MRAAARTTATWVGVASATLLTGAQWVLATSRARIARHGRDRGDVPGWVLVTIMTAGLVTALWLVADDKLTQLFNDALDSVVGGAP
jgi:hypothetical protein